LARRSLFLACIAACICSQSSAYAVDRPDLLGGSNPSLRTTVPQHQIAPGTARLSKDAIQIANALQIMPQLVRIEQLRASSATSLEYVALKQESLESIVMAGYEVHTVTSRIDRELANASEVLGYLAERRDRAVRLNSYADFISGGITGIISGGMNLGEAGGKAPDVLDTVEGVLQTGLASWALQQQRGDTRREKGIPSILAHLFGPKTEAATDYPPTVWSYLSSPLPPEVIGAAVAPVTPPPPDASRLDILVDRWIKLGLCFTHRGHRTDTKARIQHLSGASTSNKRVTIDVLEDRIAMLNDLRATVVQMNTDLLELAQTVHGVRSTGQ
jgi:hypothetical protein